MANFKPTPAADGIAAALLLASFSALEAAAQGRASAAYHVEMEMLGSVSSAGASAAYTDLAGAGETAGGPAIAPGSTHRGGYTGQLYDVIGIRFPANPLEAPETSVVTLALREIWDDATTWTPPAASASWSLLFGGEYAALSPDGRLETQAVYQNSAVLARATRPPFSGVLTVVITDNILDNFGSYAGDSLSDLWQAKNFGLGHALAGPLDDPDHDGSDNQSEYFALTDPNDASSLFSASLEADGAGGLRLVFHSVVNRRYWLETSSSLSPGSWSEIGGPLAGTGGSLFFGLPAPSQPQQIFRIRMRP